VTHRLAALLLSAALVATLSACGSQKHKHLAASATCADWDRASHPEQVAYVASRRLAPIAWYIFQAHCTAPAPGMLQVPLRELPSPDMDETPTVICVHYVCRRKG
jgi:tagatose-1,6-bisphosphate aldolase non-catalytic subunit AgaZ/GatZ